jgi:hypothetical protein
MWKKTVVVYFNLLSPIWPGGNENPTKQKKILQVASGTVQNNFFYRLSHQLYRLPSPLIETKYQWLTYIQVF